MLAGKQEKRNNKCWNFSFGVVVCSSTFCWTMNGKIREGHAPMQKHMRTIKALLFLILFLFSFLLLLLLMKGSP